VDRLLTNQDGKQEAKEDDDDGDEHQLHGADPVDFYTNTGFTAYDMSASLSRGKLSTEEKSLSPVHDCDRPRLTDSAACIIMQP
jgi:hypothetical protein